MRLAFDRESRTWVQNGGAASTVPPLDGKLLFDETTLDRAGDDFGQLVHHRPMAVLKPRSTEDIVKMVGFAREHGFKVAPRGQGFNGSGLAQAEGGVVIKMSSLEAPPVFGDRTVEVSAGMTWRQVLAATLERGLRPPVLAQALYLSVGGTLSVSGLDGSCFRYGAQVENVLELQVVTGEGRLERCSPTTLPELFNAVLSGLGQCGIILRVTLPLIPAQSQVRSFELIYHDLPAMLQDQGTLGTDGRFDGLLGFAMPAESGRWYFHLRADRSFDPPAIPDDKAVLSGLHHVRGFERIVNLPFLDNVARGPGHGVGYWYRGRVNMAHPFFGVLLPDSTIESFCKEMLRTIRPSTAEPDFVIEFYRINAKVRSRPLFRLPDGDGVYLVVFLSSYSDPDRIIEVADRSRQFFELAHSLGGTWVPSSAVSLSKQDWKDHFGSAWNGLVQAKRRFDPDNVLTPGPGIF